MLLIGHSKNRYISTKVRKAQPCRRTNVGKPTLNNKVVGEVSKYCVNIFQIYETILKPVNVMSNDDIDHWVEKVLCLSLI